MQSEILAKVIRGETIESVHRGHLIIVDGEGKTVFSLGNPETVTFWRSSAKSFQAIPVLTSGAAERFRFPKRKSRLRAVRIRASGCTRKLPPRCSKNAD